MIIRSINFHPQARTYEYRAVLFVVGIATMTILVSIARLVVILLYYRMYNRASSGVVEILTEIEATMAGCAACLPAMRVFFRKQRDTFCAKRKSMASQSNNS